MILAKKLTCTIALLGFAGPVIAQDADREALQRAAIEALVSAPEERALPLANKVLDGDYSNELKERALFVLSQIDDPAARETLLATARSGEGELREEAVRMIGIGGDTQALAALRTLYAEGDQDLREAVLEAYLIADDAEAVYELAASAQTEDDFEEAVHTLGAMGARDQLARLKDRPGAGESWLHALAIAEDGDTLIEIARDDSDPARQAQAIEALGIVGGDAVDQALVAIYREAATDDIREAALQGLLVADHDEGVLELYRASSDPAEKKELLEVLVAMDSDEIWDAIDAALDGSDQ